MDLLLLVVGMVGLALVAVTGTLVLTAAVLLRRWLNRRDETPSPLQLECGYPRRTRFSAPTYWFLPFVQIGWSWRTPLVHLSITRHGLQLHEEVAAVERTARDRITRRFVVTDAFGLSKVVFDQEENRTLKCYPAIGNLRQVHVVRSMAAGDQFPHPEGPAQGERVDMRHYAPGDPIRFILWKVFARSRQLVVRTPERAFGPIQQTVAYLVRGDMDEPAAGAARVAVESNVLAQASGEWALGADGNSETASSARHALDLLARSGDHPVTGGGSGLKHFVEDALPSGVGQLIIFVPGRRGPWLERVAATVTQHRHLRVEAMVCVDGVTLANAGGLIKQLLTRDAKQLDPRRGVGPVHESELREVCRYLAQLGARTTVLDRVQGRVYGPEHQRTLWSQGVGAPANLGSKSGASTASAAGAVRDR